MRKILLFLLGVMLSLLFTVNVYVVSVHAEETYTAEQIYEIASVVYIEANAESELGQRLVIDVILNRIDSDIFPDTLEGVLTQKSQFSKARKIPTADIIRLVGEEIADRTDEDVLFFKTKNYHSFAKPITKEGTHYFSGLE